MEDVMARVVHFELPTTDINKSKSFYEKVFGWKMEKFPGPTDYMLIDTGDPSTPGINGGLGGAANEFKATVNTVDVDDIDAILKLVVSQGGEIIMPKDVIPGVGFLAYIREPGGGVLGVIQALPDGMM
jgi:predicted enzyme related to lactoylglutathione lyase